MATAASLSVCVLLLSQVPPEDLKELLEGFQVQPVYAHATGSTLEFPSERTQESLAFLTKRADFAF